MDQQCRSRDVISKIKRIICVPWLICTCMEWLHMCAMTCSCVCLDSFLCVPCPLHMCAITSSFVWYHSFLCLPWLIPMFSMTRSYVWRIQTHSYISARPNQSFMFPYREIDFRKLIYVSFSTNIWDAVPSILFSGIWYSAQNFAVLGLFLNPVVCWISAWQKFVRRKWLELAVYQFSKGISAGLALKYLTWLIGAGGMAYGGVSHVTHMNESWKT